MDLKRKITTLTAPNASCGLRSFFQTWCVNTLLLTSSIPAQEAPRPLFSPLCFLSIVPTDRGRSGGWRVSVRLEAKEKRERSDGAERRSFSSGGERRGGEDDKEEASECKRVILMGEFSQVFHFG